MGMRGAAVATVLVCVQALAVAGAEKTICGMYKPDCGLSSEQAREKYLTPYKMLPEKLRRLATQASYTGYPMQVGPLIDNGSGGIIDINVPLDVADFPGVNKDVCGDAVTPSIREAVVCTVARDKIQPPRGNTAPEKVGLSSQGRQILGARIGNKAGIKVLVASQQHGNEASTTEGVLRVLKKLAHGGCKATSLLEKFDMLFIVRANVDGGEPLGDENPGIGVPFTKDFGFFRHTVDPQAGGGFAAPTEPDFAGVVGRGYDMNRYIFANLKNAIRPVEAQAIVAILHAFKPKYLFDMHGDVTKTVCPLDFSTIDPSGALPTVKCAPPAPSIVTLATSREHIVLGGYGVDIDAELTPASLIEEHKTMIRNIATEVYSNMNPRIEGQFTRFTQLSVGGGTLTKGTLDIGSQVLGVLGSGWEALNFSPNLKPMVTSLQVNTSTGATTPVITPEYGELEYCFLPDNNCIHRETLWQTLLATAKFVKNPPTAAPKWCTFPTDTAVVLHLPNALFGAAGTNGTVQIPSGAIGASLGVPVTIGGKCPTDP